MAFFDFFASDLEALVDMANAAFRFLIELPPYYRGLPAIRRKMQLGPRLGPSCDTLVALRFGDYTGSGPTELLTHRS
jgi:hypothetical protein